MWKSSVRVVATAIASFAIAGSAAVALPGVASADEALIDTSIVADTTASLLGAATTDTTTATTDTADKSTTQRRPARVAPKPAVLGDCDATLAGADGEAITVDAGAVLDQAGTLDVGLGSTAQSGSLITLPVEDAVELLGADDAGALTEVAADGCETVKLALNSTAISTQSLLPGGDEPNQPGENTPEPGNPGDDPADNPGEEADGDAGESVQGYTQEPAGPRFSPVGYSMPMAGALPEVRLPPIEAMGTLPFGPSLGMDPRSPRGDQHNSGLAESLPLSTDRTTKVPYVLAVITLAVVAATLVRRWMIRSA